MTFDHLQRQRLAAAHTLHVGGESAAFFQRTRSERGRCLCVLCPAVQTEKKKRTTGCWIYGATGGLVAFWSTAQRLQRVGRLHDDQLRPSDHLSGGVFEITYATFYSHNMRTSHGKYFMAPKGPPSSSWGSVSTSYYGLIMETRPPTPFCSLFIRKSEPPGFWARPGYLAFSLASSAFTGFAFFSWESCGDTEKQT